MDIDIIKDQLPMWSFALLLAIILSVAIFIALNFIARFKRKQPIVAVFAKTHAFFIIIVSLYFGTLFLELPEQAALWRFRLMVCAFAIQGGLWGNEVILYLLRRSHVLGLDEEAVSSGSITVINFVIKTVLWSLVSVFLLSNLGFDVTALVTGLGVGGIAVALAVQNILGDLFASLSIVIDKPFQIGDLILVDDQKGRVEHIGLKTTRMRSQSGEEIVIANADLLKACIKNLKRMTSRRVTFQLQIKSDTPVNLILKIPQMIKEIIGATKDAIYDRAHLAEISDCGYRFEIVYNLNNPDQNFYYDIHQHINFEILRRFDKEGIQFAFPSSTIYSMAEDPKK